MDIFFVWKEKRKNKMQMNKKKKIIGERYNEAESHNVKPVKVLYNLFCQTHKGFGGLLLMI
jgi:hypothetical protein